MQVPVSQQLASGRSPSSPAHHQYWQQNVERPGMLARLLIWKVLLLNSALYKLNTAPALLALAPSKPSSCLVLAL